MNQKNGITQTLFPIGLADPNGTEDHKTKKIPQTGIFFSITD